MEGHKFNWELGYGNGISGPTTPCDQHISAAARVARAKRDREWKEGDHESPWPPYDTILVTKPTGHGHSDTVAMFISQAYPTDAGMKAAELLAKLFMKAPEMKEFLEWAMGMPPQIWDTLPEDVREKWKLLVKSLPR